MFKDRLKELRTQKGYTMDELCAEYNKMFNGKMNKSTLSRYEHGLQEPRSTVVYNLADLFGVPADYLFGKQVNTGESIKSTRNQVGITQEQLAKASCVSVEFLKDIEAGKIMPGFLEVNKIRWVLAYFAGQLEADDLDDDQYYAVMEIEKNPSPERTTILENMALKSAIINKINRLNLEGNEKVNAYIDDLLESQKYDETEIPPLYHRRPRRRRAKSDTN